MHKKSFEKKESKADVSSETPSDLPEIDDHQDQALKMSSESLASLHRLMGLGEENDQSNFTQQTFDHTDRGMMSVEKSYGLWRDKQGNVVYKKNGEPRTITLCSGTASNNFIKMLKPKRTGYQFVSIKAKTMDADIESVISNVEAGKIELKDIVAMGDGHRVKVFHETMKAHYSNYPMIDAQSTDEQVRLLNDSGKTVCDIIMSGGTKFGHRAVGFKSETDGNWYVQDPYRFDTTKPIRFEEYAKKTTQVDKRKIHFIVPIDTSRLTQYEEAKRGLA